MKTSMRMISFALILGILLSIFTVFPISATESFTNNTGTATVEWNGTKTNFDATEFRDGFSRALKNALEYAGQVATDKNPATVTFTTGNYELINHLFIYSNTILDATGSHLRMPNSSMLSNKYDNSATEAKGYNGTKNITVVGGTWDINDDYATADSTTGYTSTFRFAHCKNLTIKNAVFINNYSGHDIELGGVSDVKIQNCTFKNDKNVNKFKVPGGKEAIQVDIATKKAMGLFPAYDSTPSKNVTVSGCTFKNKFRGIGSHHGAIGKPYSNININNNKFSNINGVGVYLINANNTKVYNNTLTNVGSGIYVSTVSNPATILNTFNYSYDKALNTYKNSKTYIFSNTVSVRSKNNTVNYIYGIRADGNYIKTTNSTSKIKKGIYYMYNVNVGTNLKGKPAPNKVNGDFDVGISLRYTKNAKASNNIINMNSSTKAKCYGIEIRCCKSTKLLNNTITNTLKKNFFGVMSSDLDNNGINVSGLTIQGNNITNHYKKKSVSDGNFGLRFYNDSTNITIKNNKIKSGQAPICASGYDDKKSAKKVYKISGNTLDSYASKSQILFRSIKLSKSTKNNYTSKKKICVVDIG